MSLLAALAFAFLYFGGDEILGIGNFASEDEEGGENENADAENGDKKEETKEGENDKNEKPSKEENVSDQKGVSSYGETDFSLLLGEQHIAVADPEKNNDYSSSIDYYSSLELGTAKLFGNEDNYWYSDKSRRRFDNFTEKSEYYSTLNLIISGSENSDYDKALDYGAKVNGLIFINDTEKIVPFDIEIIIPKKNYDGYTLKLDYIEILKDSLEKGEDLLSLIKDIDYVCYDISFTAFDSKGTALDADHTYKNEESFITTFNLLTNQASNHRSKAYFSNFSNGVFLLGKTYYHYYMQHKYSLAAIELYSSALASKDKPSSETFNNIEYFFDNIYTDLERTHTDIKEYLSQNYISADEKNAALDKLSSSVSGFSADFMSELETSLDLNIMIKNNDPYKYETKWIDWISGISGGLNHVSFSKSSMSSGSKDPIEDPVLFLEYSNLKTKGAGSYTLYYKNLILYSEGYEPLSIPDGSFNIPNTSFGHAIDILAIAEEQYGDFDLDDFISKLTHISYNFCLKKGAEADVGEKSGTISASFNYGYTADSVENIELFSKPLAFDESYSYVIEEIPRIDTELLTWDSVFGFTFAVDCGNKENVNIGYYIEIEKKDNKDISVRYTPEKTFAHSAPFRFTSDFAEESFNQNDINKLKELISNLEKITVTVTLVQH